MWQYSGSKVTAFHLRALVVQFCLALSVFGCGDQLGQTSAVDVTGEAESVESPPVATDFNTIGEAVSVPEFLQRLRVARPVTTTIIRARVQRLSARERTVPAYVWPEAAEPIIVTTARLIVDEVLCGPQIGQLVELSYIGGRIGRRFTRTSLMPADLNPGDEHVLVVSPVEGENFLVGGKYELLTVESDGGPYRDFAGRQVTRDAIAGGCP
jgi:hypothetical protein